MGRLSAVSAGVPLIVVFALLAEAGHHTGSFRLARELRRRGHRVVYLGLADLRALVEAQGFEYMDLAPELLPAGSLAAATAGRRGRWSRLRRRRADEALFGAFLHEIVDGPLDERLRACAPDVVLCDTFVWYVALRALRLGLPVIDLSIILSLRPNAIVPPVTSALRPRAGGSPSWRVRAAWLALRLRFLFTKSAAALLFGRFRFPTRMHHLVGVFRRVARRSGYPLEENRTWWYGEMGPRLALPEIVLCPRALQFAGGPEDGRLYLAETIDLERSEEPLPSGAIDASKPLVYVSLGTSSASYPHAGRFFAAVVGASHSRPDWQFVLHVGDHPALARLRPPPNLRIAARVPQLALLARAAAFVTHGGINSIREAIHFGVPMVIVPALRDQPGNAARAVEQGIAIAADMATLGADELVARVERVANDAELRGRLARFRSRVEAEGGLEAAVRLVESAALRGGRS